MKLKGRPNTITISFVILTAALLTIFFLVIYQPGAGMYIRADVLPEQPDKYVEFTFEELESYLYVKEAVSNPGEEVKLPFDRTESLISFRKLSGQMTQRT